MLQTDGPGVLEIPGLRSPLISIHVGRPVRMNCHRGSHSHEGLFVHGDIDIVPAGLPCKWEIKSKDTALLLSLSPQVLRDAAARSDQDAGEINIRNRFQMRDPQIEHIGWALKAEAETGFPNGALYIDCLATALALQLLRVNNSSIQHERAAKSGISPRRLKQVLSFIEDHLSEDLSLEKIAAVSGLSSSHFKVVFRNAVGMPVYQYVIRRRVERAAALLQKHQFPISQIALEAGFAHQSHLAFHMRRVFGMSPAEFRRQCS